MERKKKHAALKARPLNLASMIVSSFGAKFFSTSSFNRLNIIGLRICKSPTHHSVTKYLHLCYYS